MEIVFNDNNIANVDMYIFSIKKGKLITPISKYTETFEKKEIVEGKDLIFRIGREKDNKTKTLIMHGSIILDSIIVSKMYHDRIEYMYCTQCFADMSIDEINNIIKRNLLFLEEEDI